MAKKGFLKKFNRELAGRSLRAFFVLIKILPECSLYFLANTLYAMVYLFTVRHRRIARESLHIAFGNEKSEDEIKEIAKESFRNMAKGAFELIYLVEHLDWSKTKVVIENKEYLDRVLSKGNGAIVVSAHFGNFPLMFARFAAEGYTIKAVIRPMRDEKIDVYLRDKREKLGIHTIYSSPRDVCVRESLQALRRNKLLFIQLDQNFGTGGIFVDFFGQKAATATGPVVFALRTGASILPAFIIREKDDTLRIIIEPPIIIEGSEKDGQVIQKNVQKITNVIERYIRKYPQEWSWIHRRWKSKPKDQNFNLEGRVVK